MPPDVITISLTLTTPGAQASTFELNQDTWVIGSGSTPDIFSIEVPGVACVLSRVFHLRAIEWMIFGAPLDGLP